MAEPVRPRVADVFAWVPAAVFEAAEDYVRLGRVRAAWRQGDLLGAEVEGTHGVHAVRLRLRGADLPPAEAAEARCDCPSRRPLCRHVVALALQWAETPEAFLDLDLAARVWAALPAAEAAAALARVAVGEASVWQVLSEPLRLEAWEAAPPGRCLEAWEGFRAAAEAAGRWPDAALELVVRIAGAPEPSHPALAARQLAWWLGLAAGELPAPALAPWLRRLEGLWTALERQGGCPGEVVAAVAALLPQLPEGFEAEVGWFVRAAAAAPARGVFEAELERRIWGWELALRLAGDGRAEGPAARLLQRAQAVRAAWAEALS